MNMKAMKILLLSLVTLFSTLPAWAAEKVWIDVRTPEEYQADHINGDANIPLQSLKPEELAAKYGKDAELMLYCRSGNRAGQAKQLLETAGFTKVTNAGSIGDVRQLRKLAEGNASPTRK
jgi:phage shock protein E